MAVEIRMVRTASEARAVFRLRYEVYVEELGRTQRYADHAARMLEEPLDACAYVFCACDGTRVVGTVRGNCAYDSPLNEYETLYQMQRCGAAHPQHTSITTKLVVAPSYRRSLLPYRLAATAYYTGLCKGVLFDFIDVYAARVPFFERLGYRVHRAHAVHPDYGDVIVMRLGMRDAQHLSAVDSPLLRVLARAPRAAA